MPILRLAGKAPRRRRPVNSALGTTEAILSISTAVYEAAGRSLELAHQLEATLVSLLLLADGLRSGSPQHVFDNRYLQLLERIEQQMLGKSISRLLELRPELSDSAHILKIALKARNQLAHGIFASKKVSEMTDSELSDLKASLEYIELDLRGGLSVAAELATPLVDEWISARLAGGLEWE